jgi:hypothetical protein
MGGKKEVTFSFDAWPSYNQHDCRQASFVQPEPSKEVERRDDFDARPSSKNE